MTAYDLKEGESARISRGDILGGAGERLCALGFVRGRTVTALGFSLLKSCVLLGCGAVRLAVGRPLAEKIFVERTA